jgi:hypothetical protein
MDALPEDLRTAITLRETRVESEEIASVMNCPIGTVRSRIFRAREAIAAELRHSSAQMKTEMVMNENISRLMDGEVDAQEFDLLCGNEVARGDERVDLLPRHQRPAARRARRVRDSRRFPRGARGRATMLASFNDLPAPAHRACGHGAPRQSPRLPR